MPSATPISPQPKPRPRQPLVLFDDARSIGAVPSRLYRDPVQILQAHDPDSLDQMLDTLRSASRDGLHAAGYLAYEAGYALEPRLQPLLEALPPMRLGWFGLFKGYDQIDPDQVEAFLAQEADTDSLPSWLGPVQPATSQADYAQAFAEVREQICAGEIYQANLTFQNHASFCGDPVALYTQLRVQSQSGYGGLLFDGDDWLLSLSPELFFTLHQGRLVARPMKGTALRHTDPATDRSSAETLQASVKDQAENLMIVDLLRNDLSRVAEPASVAVSGLFAIESFPTVHQMTSTVTAALSSGKDAVDVLRALFPCGSITGAPKIRAMELLRQIEPAPRGVYCGSLGRIDPASVDGPGDAAFNVAIRTLQFTPQAQKLSFGLGSGVVADSECWQEWQECLSKGKFVTNSARRFDLIETMRFEPATGIWQLEAHLERMKTSARFFGFAFDRHDLRNALNAACFHLEQPSRVRVLLSPSGATSIAMSDAPAPRSEPMQVVLQPLTVRSDDPRLAHKTTDRGFYDAARQLAKAETGADEVLFTDPLGRITEGSFTHVFVERGDMLLTPPLGLGLLPGILRRNLIETGKAQEAVLTEADVQQGLWIGNALRGLMRAEIMTD